MALEAVVCASCGVRVPVPSRVPVPVPKVDGEILDGHWRLERKLGRGGMGTVYLAHDLELDRQVAIKMLAPQFCDDPGLVQRFEREARMMAKLDHPNLVPVYAVGRTPSGPYIVMKLLTGMTLAEALKTRGRMSLEAVHLVTRQVAAGLQFIHDRQVIHRDIKPANIFIGPDGHATLLDLGVARHSTSDLTGVGVLIGTPRYMSPEQIRGEPADHRSDLYALATVVYEMVTGQPVFDADSDFSLMRAHIDQPPPDPSTFVEVPPALASALLKGLSKSPADRFQSAKALAEALEDAIVAPHVTREPSSLEALVPTVPPARVTPKPGAGAGPPSRPGAPRPRTERAASVALEAAERGSGNMGLWAALAVLVLVSGGGVSYLVSGGLTVEDERSLPRAQEPERPMAKIVLPTMGSAPEDAGVHGATGAGVTVPPAVQAEESVMRPEAGVMRAEEGVMRKPDGPIGGEAPAPRVIDPGNSSPKGGRAVERVVHPAKGAVSAPESEHEKGGSGVVRCLVTANKVSSWAYVQVDGMRRGAAPLVLKLEVGRHELVFIRAGFKTQSREVMVAPGDDTKLLVEMVQ